MGKYKNLDDDFSLREESPERIKERAFRDEHLDSVRFDLDADRFHETVSQQGLEVSIEHSESIRSSRRNVFVSFFRALPRRRRIQAGLSLLVGVVLIAAIAGGASKKNQTYGESSEFRKKNGSSRFNNGGRGQGGGAGNMQNLPDYFVTYENENFFSGEDVRIPPYSVLDPVEDMERFDFWRPEASLPSGRLDPLVENQRRALPTNAWYQNMLRLEDDQNPTKDHRVYTIPYIIDASGDFAGIRAHATRLLTNNIQVEVKIDEPWGLTLGAMPDVSLGLNYNGLEKGYSVIEATDLGLTLEWEPFMKTTLVRGSPYVTMIYDMSKQVGVLPTMHWKLDTSELPIIDGSRTVDCSREPVFTVERDLEVVFFNSNQRWIVFFSRPVQLRCQNDRGRPTIFQVKQEGTEVDELIIRGALVVSSSSDADDDESFVESYSNQLRASADVYPGDSTSVVHSFNEERDLARISFDWDARSMHKTSSDGITSRYGHEMIMFALPHHREILSGKVSPTLCTTSMLGPACLVEGNVWNMYENLPDIDFRAPRHPDPQYLPLLAQALVEDIRYQIPSNFQSGASDTYFSGKTTAKLARILLIAEEVKELCTSGAPEYLEACNTLELPSDQEIEEALNQLRDAVTLWVRTNTKAPFVYDSAWGGLVNCGCQYNNGECTNVFPNCPAFNDQGLNFGNAFYNDHHFHYGYHVYSAAALAHFDSSWAVELYEDVALLVRDYANPSDEDTAFPVFRNKDWYRGHSWAGGITNPMFRNMMNQESVSEAVMSYEAVALFGKTMTSIFEKEGDFDGAYIADMMYKIGKTLAATEIRSAQKYYQVRQSAPESERIYPEAYPNSVVGILWETFAQFTTWFGNSPYLIYGIQLLPITPIAEARDAIEWANEIYGPLSQSCDGKCVQEGWSIQINAILATIGRVQEAVEGILSIPSNAYEFAGGNGHSKSNALWYVTTRSGSVVTSFLANNEENIEIEEQDSNPAVGEDVALIPSRANEGESVNEESESKDVESNDINLGRPVSGGNSDINTSSVPKSYPPNYTCFTPFCTEAILNMDADGYKCGDRINYLMYVMGMSELNACEQVAVDEYPSLAQCGYCRPQR